MQKKFFYLSDGLKKNEMTNSKKIIKNALANGAGFVFEAIIAVCMLPFIIHRIGESAYGVWVLVLSVTGYMGILNLGLRPAINKYVAQYNALGDIKKIREIVQTCLFTYFLCSILVLLISIILYFNANLIFHIPEEYHHSVPILILLVGIQMSLGLIAVVYGGVISGLQRYEINNGIEIFVMLCRTVIIVFFLNKYPTIYTIAAAHFCMTIIGYFITFFIARKIVDLKKLEIFRIPGKESFVAIFNYSIITFFIGVVGRIMIYADSFVIASFLTTSAVTYYVVGSRMVKYSRNLIEVLMNVVAPAVSELDAKNDSKIGDIFIFSSKAAALLSFPILMFFIIQGDDFLSLWIGIDYPQSYYVMIILSVSGLIAFPQMSVVPILYGTAKHDLIMKVSMVEGVISIVASILLCKYFGILGVAFGLAVPKVIIGCLIYPVYMAKFAKVNLFYFFRTVYLRSAIVTLPMMMVLLGVKFYFHFSWLILFLEILVNILLHLISILWIGLSLKERKALFPNVF